MEKKEEKIGFTIGKFAPFHKGHQYLIETARKEMDKVIVVVYDTDVIDIPTEKRANWIKELYPDVEIRYAHNPPSQYGLDKDSVNIQMEYLTKIIGKDKPTHFYSSEKYGEKVADYMDIVDRRVDMQRVVYPVSGTKVRSDVEGNKKYLEDNIYNDIKK